MSKLEEKLKLACGKYECVKKEKCENDNFISSENYRCTLRNGKVIERNKIIKNGGNGDASIIVPLTDNNEVILTIQLFQVEWLIKMKIMFWMLPNVNFWKRLE